MKKLVLIFAMFAAVACSKDKDAAPSNSIVGKWNADKADEYLAHWEFTADGKFYSRLRNGQHEIAPKDSGRYKFDGSKLTTTFIDRYVSGVAVIAYDTVRCQVAGNKMTLDIFSTYTRQN